MNRKTQAKINAAKDAEKVLKSNGQHEMAQVMENLRRGLTTQAGNNSTLWKDNAKLLEVNKDLREENERLKAASSAA